MAQLLQTSISGSSELTGSLIVSGSQPVQLPLLNSGSGEIDLGTGYQFWFDSGDNYVKYHVKGSYQAGAWSAGGNLITGRSQGFSDGEQDAAFLAGGRTSPAVQSLTEEYDGSAWAAGGTLNTARRLGGAAGTQNAGLIFGGNLTTSPAGPFSNATEEYSGTTWANGGNLITTRKAHTGAGTQNAGLSVGGATPTKVTCTEEYNGSAWASGGGIITARENQGGTGTQNAGLIFGGETPSVVSCTEEYNGTSWSVGGAMINVNYGMAGAGIQNAAVVMGGRTPSDSNVTEEYDGTSWSSQATLSQTRYSRSGAGAQHAALVTGGTVGGSTFSATTEEYTRPYVPPFSCYLDDGAWTTSDSLINSRFRANGAGTQNAGLAIGGCSAPITGRQCTEEYNGSTWSAGGDLITGRSDGGASGTQNAGLQFGGRSNPSIVGCTEEYDGTSWSAGGALINVRCAHAGAGSQNAAVAVGGYDAPSQFSCVEEYNGTSWASATAYPSVTQALGGSGEQNSGIFFGGLSPNDSTSTNFTGEYNGSAWSTGGTMSTARFCLGDAGANGTSLAFGGRNPSGNTCTEEYDGSSWSTKSALLANGGNYGYFGLGTQENALGWSSSTSYEYNKTLICTGTYCCFLNYGTVTDSAGPNMLGGTNSGYKSDSSSTGASYYAGGNGPGVITCTQEYNGTSFSAGGTFDITGIKGQGGAAGTSNAGLAFGQRRNTLSPARTTCSAEYNGSAWSSGNAKSICGGMMSGAGTQNSALSVGGYPNCTCTEEYNGTSWSTGGALPANTLRSGASGPNNDSVRSIGGQGNDTNQNIQYNGSTWSSDTDLPYGTTVISMAAHDDIDQALTAGGGEAPAGLGCITTWDGTAWSNVGTLNNAIGDKYGLNGSWSNGYIAFGGFRAPADPSAVTSELTALPCNCSYANLTCCTRCLDATCTQI